MRLTSCGRRRQRRLAAGAAFTAIAVLASASPAAATAVTPTAYDISYPQCGQAFPAAAEVGIVGVNEALPYSPNPCLGTSEGQSELEWAIGTGDPEFYANTADPGPANSSHWPAAGTKRDGHRCAGDNSRDCSFVYGYLAAADSFADAVAAESDVAAADPNAAAAGVQWWLDVEHDNSWQVNSVPYDENPAAAEAADTADVAGAVAALRDAGVTSVGLYSNATQWQEITGGTGNAFAQDPTWVTLASDATAAAASCGPHGFAGGPVRLSQYQFGGYDADYRCPSRTTLHGPEQAATGTRVELTGTTGPAAAVVLEAAGPTGPLRQVGRATAGADGSFAFRQRLRHVTRYAAVAAGRRSSILVVGDNPTLTGPRRAGGHPVRLHGIARPGDRVTLQRLNGHRAHAIGSVRASRPTGAYHFTVRVRTRSRFRSVDGTLTSKVRAVSP